MHRFQSEHSERGSSLSVTAFGHADQWPQDTPTTEMSAVHVPREGLRNQDPTKVFKGWEWESGSIFLPPVALFHLAFAILPLVCTFLRIYICKPTSLKFTQLLFPHMTTKIRWLSLLLVEPHWSTPPPLYLEALKRQPPSQGTYPHIVIILLGILVPHYPFQLRTVLLFSPQDSRNDSCFDRVLETRNWRNVLS